MHTPVLLKEVLESLNIKKDGLYIDATAGEAGHTVKIVELGGKVLALDQDSSQIEKLKTSIQDKKFTLVNANFSEIETAAKENNFFPVDGILFDLGLSMSQIKDQNRGFSYRNLDEPLDMRIDTRKETTAADLVNSLTQEEIYEIFARYGEEINSLAISKVLVHTRTLKPIVKVGDLIEVIDKVTGQNSNRTYARIFQALRIKVNDEMENLRKGLEGSLKILKRDGRIVMITFHSLEDRLVKQFTLKNNLTQLNKKIIKSDNRHGFERSAKLRILAYEKFN